MSGTGRAEQEVDGGLDYFRACGQCCCLSRKGGMECARQSDELADVEGDEGPLIP